MLENKKFTMKDESFLCEVCGKKVEKLNYTARDHCKYCLCSKHVDIFPGDRMENCHGILRPIAIEKSSKDRYKIVYRCEKCGAIRKNVSASDDNFEEILNIMKRQSI